MEGCHLMVVQETFRYRSLTFQRSQKTSVSYLLTEDLSDLVAARTYLDLIYCFWICLKGFSVVNLSFCVLPKWSWKSTDEIHNLVALHVALELKHLYTVHPFSSVGICNRIWAAWSVFMRYLFGDFGEGNGTPLQYSSLGIPGTGEPGGLPSMGSHRVGHDSGHGQWRNIT